MGSEIPQDTYNPINGASLRRPNLKLQQKLTLQTDYGIIEHAYPSGSEDVVH